jgi:hypothetical protein
MSKAQEKQTAVTPPKNKAELWSVICHLRDFTLPDITSSEGVPLRSIRRYVASFVKSGHLKEEVIRKTGIYKRYHVVRVSTPPNVGVDGAKKKPHGRQRMWTGMKVKKVFDFREVALFATVPLEAARQYCYALRNAGYLLVRTKATANGTPEIYIFNRAKDTGIHAPSITRDKEVYDRNLGQIVWPESEGT